jgi:hypothetical protein
MLAIALCLGLVATTATVSAGKRVVEPVKIFDEVDTGSGKPTGAGRAQGALADARASADATQMIGCWTAQDMGICYAVDAAGKSRGCTTHDPAQLAVLRSLTSESMLYINWNPYGTCTGVWVETGSVYKPRATTGD